MQKNKKHRTKTALRAILAGALLLLFPVSTSFAQTNNRPELTSTSSGKIEFTSYTVAGALTVPRKIRAGLKPVKISGQLTLPANSDRLPFMVIAHGSGGVSENHTAWARFLVDNGIAAFVVDSFTGRGIKETGTDQDQLTPWSNAADAMMALDVLSLHPRLDPKKAGVLGGSRGGQVALYTALEEFAAGLVTPDRRFAVHFALYPSCSTRYVGARHTGRPIHFLLGERDDYTPANQCVDYANWFKAQGASVEIKTYFGAHHGFDRSTRPSYSSDLQNYATCWMEYDLSQGTSVKLPAREAMTREEVAAYYKTCWRRGATVGGEVRALADARAHVLSAVKSLGW